MMTDDAPISPWDRQPPAPWRDPENYSGPKRHKCLGCGCACAKSPWGKWCHSCNVERMQRLNKAMAGAARSIGNEKLARELEEW